MQKKLEKRREENEETKLEVPLITKYCRFCKETKAIILYMRKVLKVPLKEKQIVPGIT